MKSAILVKSKKALVVDNIELPQQLFYGQVLVKIKYSGICGSQINEIDAVKGPDKHLPHLLGHEGSGVVEKIGEGVTRVKKEITLFCIGEKAQVLKLKTLNIFGKIKL